MENKVNTTHNTLLDYATKMKVRGEKTSSIMGYLEQNCSNQGLIKQVIEELKEVDNPKPIQNAFNSKNKYVFVSLLLVGVCIIVGAILFLSK